jgi:predicted transcriptional regulator of viral defense system
MNIATLVNYALRIETGAVLRRLGYLLEFYGFASGGELGRLKDALTETYSPLDPMLPREGAHLRRWRLQLNIAPEELESIRSS